MMDTGKISLRPVTDADDPVLLEIYASTRVQELDMVPWGEEQKNAFVKMQFEAQTQHYKAEHPQANHDLICLADAPVGRLYLDRQAERLHILDITVLPQHRNTGIGSFVLRQILEEAAKSRKPVTIYVETFNPSVRLFERLAFQRDQETGLHFLMKWCAAP